MNLTCPPYRVVTGACPVSFVLTQVFWLRSFKEVVG